MTKKARKKSVEIGAGLLLAVIAWQAVFPRKYTGNAHSLHPELIEGDGYE